jgi:hypothetical protein
MVGLMREMTTGSGRRTIDWSWLVILTFLAGFWVAVALLLTEGLSG